MEKMKQAEKELRAENKIGLKVRGEGATTAPAAAAGPPWGLALGSAGAVSPVVL